MSKLERQLPIPDSVVTAEKAIIGTMIKDEAAFWAVQEKLRAAHFSVPLHMLIYTAIHDICFDQKRLSVQLLLSKLPDTDPQLGLVKSYVFVLLETAQDIGSPADFVDELIEKWGLREGAKAAEKAFKAFQKGDKTVVDIVAELTARTEEIGAHADADSDVPIQTIVRRVMTNSSKAFESPEFVAGYSTGLPKLDSMIGLLRPGRLYFVGGDAKAGKTALAMQMIRPAARMGTALMAQTEMPEDEVGARELGSEAGISASKMETGQFNQFDYEEMLAAEQRIAGSNLRVWQCGNAKISRLRNKCLAVKRAHGLSLLMADHLLNFESDKEYDNEFRGIGVVVNGLKNIAVDLNIPVLCMTHRTRSAQDRNDPTPFATDFYGGGSIERFADALICIYSKYNWLLLRKPENRGPEAVTSWQKQLVDNDGKRQIALVAHRHMSFPKIEDFGWDGPATKLVHI